jgi:DNA replication protein DnaC
VNQPKPLSDVMAEVIQRGKLSVSPDAEPFVEPDLDAIRDAIRRRWFDELCPPLFSDASLAALGPRQAMPEVLEWLGSSSPTLILAGAVGVGKTYIGWAIAREALESGMYASGSTMIDLLDSLRPDAMSLTAGHVANVSDVFLFDDLGTERATEWTVEQFGALIDRRTRECRRQIITTNASPAELEDRYGPRIMSRLTGGATVAKITGDDRRRELW